MFKVKHRFNDYEETVYGVKHEDGETWFLIWTGNWYWKEASYFEPVERL